MPKKGMNAAEMVERYRDKRESKDPFLKKFRKALPSNKNAQKQELIRKIKSREPLSKEEAEAIGTNDELLDILKEDRVPGSSKK